MACPPFAFFPPRIAALWDDLDTGAGGSVTFEDGGDSVTISYSGVPQWLVGDSNSFAITLFNDGRYVVAYGSMDAADGIAGTTEGGGAADPGESNLSSSVSWPGVGTTYEHFSGFDNDLSGAIIEYNP